MTSFEELTRLADAEGDNLPCRNAPDLFFQDAESGSTIKQAKSLCAQCPIRNACLEYALQANEYYGIWGGLTMNERRMLKRQAILAGNTV